MALGVLKEIETELPSDTNVSIYGISLKRREDTRQGMYYIYHDSMHSEAAESMLHSTMHDANSKDGIFFFCQCTALVIAL